MLRKHKSSHNMLCQSDCSVVSRDVKESKTHPNIAHPTCYLQDHYNGSSHGYITAAGGHGTFYLHSALRNLETNNQEHHEKCVELRIRGHGETTKSRSLRAASCSTMHRFLLPHSPIMLTRPCHVGSHYSLCRQMSGQSQRELMRCTLCICMCVCVNMQRGLMSVLSPPALSDHH